MEEKIKVTKVQTIGKVVRGLQEVFSGLDCVRIYQEKNTKRLPRRQEYSIENINLLLKCPTNHHVVRELEIRYIDERDRNLVYAGLKIAGAI